MKVMLWVISTILLLLWLAGITMAYTFGGFIHLLLILAVAFMIVQYMEAHRTV
jgi:hypothetical protein